MLGESVEPMVDALLEHDPVTLEASGNARGAYLALYRSYADELAELTRRMAGQRRAMLARGLSADFSDRESELLYMLVRELRPETVVEISPCHGYSTNYIVAALAANGGGHLHSYELPGTVAGRPIEAVIRDSLLEGLPQTLLSVHVGDVREADVPTAELLFIDSSHEDHFAAWLLQTQVPRAGVVLQHDLVVRRGDHYEAKGWEVGPRESSLTLAALARSGQPFFAAAAARVYLAGHDGQLAERYPASERAIVYRGHVLSPGAAALCSLARDAYEKRKLALEGLRLPAVEDIPPALGFVERCLYGSMLAELGYTAVSSSQIAGYRELVEPRPRGRLSSAELVFYFHYLQKTGRIATLLRAGLRTDSSAANAAFARSVRRRFLRSLAA
jgi:predicted O-methyltransferase YrrM